jgi:hypothetical protein
MGWHCVHVVVQALVTLRGVVLPKGRIETQMPAQLLMQYPTLESALR